MLLSTSPTMVADINQATADSNVSLLANLGNGKVVFFASDGFHGAEPYVTDGTAAGTLLLKDINPGPASSTPQPSSLHSDNQTAVVANGRLFFQADDGVDGYELWCTDGTPGGTTLVKDINPGIANSNPTQMVAVGNTVFFVAYVGANSTQLWKSDGTAAGTSMVTTIGTLANPGFQLGTGFNGRLFFTADDGVHGNELWSSDGTAAGTAMVADIDPGQTSSDPVELTVSGSQLFFTTEDGTTASKLWVTDGTSAGTHLAADLGPGGAYLNLRLLTDVNGTLFFENWNGSGLYKSDGTSAGTVLVHSFNSSGAIDNMINYGGRDYFVANDGVSGSELWQSDGTTAGTTQVADLAPGAASAFPYGGGLLTVAGSNLFFAANVGGGAQLYVITAVGAAPTAISPAGSVELGNYLGNPQHFAAVGSGVYFNGFSLTAGAEPWHSDGTAAGTAMVADIDNAITIGSNPSTLTEINGRGVFAANDSIHGIELWVTDGSASGTTLLKDIVPGPGDGLARGPIGPSFIPAQLGNYFYFAAGTGNGQVWRTDGTTAGTTLCLSFTAGSTTNGYGGVSQLTAVNGSLYFFADDGTGTSLYVSDGTPSGTRRLQYLLPPSLNDYQPAATEFSAVGSRVVFAATDSSHGTEPWVTDGTPAGTMLLNDVYAGTSSSLPTEFYGLQRFVSLGSAAYFIAQSLSGLALWRTDGTPIGTSVVKNFTAIGIAGVNDLTPFKGSLYFSTYVGLNYYQGGDLWTSDGTASGTVLVASFPSNKDLGAPSSLTVLGNTLFFFAPPSPDSDPVGLFASDGTASDIVLVPVADEDQLGFSPIDLTNVQGTLYFTARGPGDFGQLWRVDQSSQGDFSVENIWSETIIAFPPSPSNLSGLDGTLFFQETDSTHGSELWKLNLLQADAGGPYLATGAIQLDASASRDPNPSYPLSYSWDLDGDGIFGETGSTAYLGNETGVNPTYFANQFYPGVYPVTVQVNGSWQNTATATSYVTVPPRPHFAGDTLTFNAVANASTQSWTIDWGDGTPVENYTGNTTSISHIFATASGASPFIVQFSPVGASGAIQPLPMPVTIYADPVLNNGLLTLTGTSGSDVATAAGGGGEFDVGLNGAVRKYNSSMLSRFIYNDGGGDDQIELRDGFFATLNLSTGNDWITNFGATAIINPGTGKIRLDTPSGSTTIAASSGSGIRQIPLSAINISAGAKVVFANTSSTLGDYSNHANRTLAIVDAGGLNIATGGFLDMGDNSMILKYLAANKSATDSMVQSLLASASDTGAWDGATGIGSSEASFDALGSSARAVGWADQNDVGNVSFEGDTADIADGNEIMIKLTYYGDTDLSGTVDSTDSSNFSLGLHGFGDNGNAGWEFGDFDYSGSKPNSNDTQAFSLGLHAYRAFGAL